MKQFLSFLLKPSAWIAKVSIGIFLILFLWLGYSDHLTPIKEFLDSENLSFHVGATKFSAYALVKALATIIGLLWVVSILSDFGEIRIKKLRKMRSSNKALITKFFQIVLYTIAFLIGLDILGVDLTSLAIFSGAVGIGLGFGLQKITSNFISGLILLFEKSIETDDLVELNDGTFAYIRQINARYTLVETYDGKEIMIPNEEFITNRVVNWTFNDSNARVDVKIGISYDSDIEKAMEIMLKSATNHPRTMSDPKPECYLREYGDSSINFVLFFWVEDITDGRFEPQSDVMRTIWKEFKENNISIPFPQRDIHIKHEEGR